jgi:hypothetical protein
MPEAYFVARSLGVDLDYIAPADLGVIVGDDTALDSRDGDTSYINVKRERDITGIEIDLTEMPFRWEPLGLVPGVSSIISMTLEAEYRSDEDATGSGSSVGLASMVDAVEFSMTAPFFTASTTYVYDTRPALFAENIISGAPWRIVPVVPSPNVVNSFRFTYLRVVIVYGEPRLRQKNRGSIRQKNKAARQDSIRSKSFY